MEKHQGTLGLKTRLLLKIMHTYHPWLGLHSLRVGRLSARLAWEIGLCPKSVRMVSMGGLLHDIGKIAIPIHILLKEGELEPEERALMQEHPVLGWEILKGEGYPDPVLTVVLYHHERKNGRGYPFGLQDPPLFPSIVGLADAFTALTEPRPYRSPMDPGAAIRLLEESFSPMLISALRRVYGL